MNEDNCLSFSRNEIEKIKKVKSHFYGLSKRQVEFWSSLNVNVGRFVAVNGTDIVTMVSLISPAASDTDEVEVEVKPKAKTSPSKPSPAKKEEKDGAKNVSLRKTVKSGEENRVPRSITRSDIRTIKLGIVPVEETLIWSIKTRNEKVKSTTSFRVLGEWKKAIVLTRISH